MRDRSMVAIDRDEVLAPHYIPEDLTEKFAVLEQQRRRHWIWTFIVSTGLTTMGLVIWLVNRL